MKPRNREINVFSMSLLDILCGALGAFAFLFILVLPDYHPGLGGGGEETKDMVDPKTYQEAMDRVHQLEDQVKQQKGKSKQQEEEIRNLSLRDPIAVLATFTGEADMDLYVRAPGRAENGKSPEPVDPNRPQYAFWNSHMYLHYDRGPASEVWLMRDTLVGNYEIYYKLMTDTPPPSPVQVAGIVMSAIDEAVFIPLVQLTRPRQVVHVATVQMLKNSHTKVQILVGNGGAQGN